MVFSTDANAHNSELEQPEPLIFVTGSFEGWTGSGIPMIDLTAMVYVGISYDASWYYF